MYNYIFSPINDKKVKVKSYNGRQILKKYIQILLKGGSGSTPPSTPPRVKSDYGFFTDFLTPTPPRAVLSRRHSPGGMKTPQIQKENEEILEKNESLIKQLQTFDQQDYQLSPPYSHNLRHGHDNIWDPDCEENPNLHNILFISETDFLSDIYSVISKTRRIIVYDILDNMSVKAINIQCYIQIPYTLDNKYIDYIKLNFDSVSKGGALFGLEPPLRVVSRDPPSKKVEKFLNARLSEKNDQKNDQIYNRNRMLTYLNDTLKELYNRYTKVFELCNEFLNSKQSTIDNYLTDPDKNYLKFINQYKDLVKNEKNISRITDQHVRVMLLMIDNLHKLNFQCTILERDSDYKIFSLNHININELIDTTEIHDKFKFFIDEIKSNSSIVETV